MRAEQFIVFFIHDEFYPARVISKPQRLAVCLKGEFGNFHVIAAFARLRLGQPERGNLRLAIGRAGHHLVIEREGGRACDVFRADNPLRRADVREHQLSRHVANRPNAGDVGRHSVVDFDEAARIEADSQRFQPETGGVGTESNRDERLFRFENRLLPFGGNGDADALRDGGYRFDFMSGQDADSALDEGFAQFLAHFFIFQRDEARQHLHDSDFDSIRMPNGGKLHADGAGADNHYRFGEGFLQNRLPIGKDFFAVYLPAAGDEGMRAGGEDEILRLERFRAAF